MMPEVRKNQRLLKKAQKLQEKAFALQLVDLNEAYACLIQKLQREHKKLICQLEVTI